VNERFESATGTDADARQLADCRERFRDLHRVLFLPQDLVDNDPRFVAAYDVVTCMEVLEHCLEETRRQVIGQLRRLVKPSGRVVVSVPIETGLSLPAKQAARRAAGWREIGDYRHAERYSWAELFRMTCAGATTQIRRPVYETDANRAEEPYRFHGHKGFNWRIVEREIAAVFDITERRHSPMPALGSVLNSQVWMVCRPR
jgi:SAM-dependent methyltransferase